MDEPTGIAQALYAGSAVNAYAVFALIAIASVLSFFAGEGAKEREQLKAEQQAAERRVQKEREYRKKGEEHDALVGTLTAQRDEARAQLASATTGRHCLEPRAVRVLNAAGRVPSPSEQPARAPKAPERPESERSEEAFATDRDVSEALLECRVEYGKISDQLNTIIDIELSRTK